MIKYESEVPEWNGVTRQQRLWGSEGAREEIEHCEVKRSETSYAISHETYAEGI